MSRISKERMEKALQQLQVISKDHIATKLNRLKAGQGKRPESDKQRYLVCHLKPWCPQRDFPKVGAMVSAFQ